MGYRILTYTNPYELDKTPYWNELRGLPHFCVARTLVNGLVDVMRDSIDGLICPLDDLIKHERVYKAWEDNIARRIEQHSYLTKLFAITKEKSKDPRKETFFAALTKNQSQFLDAIRLFTELNIPASSLHQELATKEQKAFVRVLARLQANDDPLFRFPATPDLSELKLAIDDLAKRELKEYRKQMQRIGEKPDPKREQWLQRNIEHTKSMSLTGFVVHGVHQFSPAQLRLITDLGRRENFTVYFLFNYQPKYSSIYDSWLSIYENFETKIETDGKEYAIIPPQDQTVSNSLATALGLLCEGEYTPADPMMRSSYETYKTCKLIKFANLTEYANYVAKGVDAAKRKYWSQLKPLERGRTSNGSRAVLRLLDEQVYTANRDIHDLLNMYFPEYSKNRHFLSYPIGQFFSNLYRLWDWEAGELRFELPAIRECITSGLVGCGQAERLLRISYVLEIIIGKIERYSGVEDSFVSQMGKYLSLYDEVSKATVHTKAAEVKSLSIYNSDTISRQEIVLFIDAVKQLNDSAVYLFGQSHEDFVQFGQHFGRLQDYIKEKKNELVTQAETDLINDLLARLQYVVNSSQDVSGTFYDLRQGLYFYLKQKQEEQGSDWVVKNFEQIDGDILHSRKQHRLYQKKAESGDRDAKDRIYHFACLSDRDMNVSIDHLLPWPLTDEFILKAYTPIDLQFQVYYSALSERNGFLRYALFYGLYFNYCDVRLSFVEETQDEITEPFTLLSLLGINTNDYQISGYALQGDQVIPPAEKLKRVNVDKFHLMSMMLCPHRYLMEYVIREKPVADSEFLYQKVFESALLHGVWSRCANQKADLIYKNLVGITRNEASKLQKYFFFWNKIQIEDICRRVVNYMKFGVLEKNIRNGYLKVYGDIGHHTEIRKRYGQGSIYVDISEKEPQNPYPAFEAITRKEGQNKIYSLHQFNDNAKVPQELLADIRSYLGKSMAEKQTVVSDWCAYCTCKDICLDPFVSKE